MIRGLFIESVYVYNALYVFLFGAIVRNFGRVYEIGWKKKQMPMIA